MKRPELFILGAPKCATTSLYSLLTTHSQIFSAPVKEPGYYTRSEVRSDVIAGARHLQSEEGYLDLYSAAAEHLVCCDASTSYLRSRIAIDQIAAISPDTKVIAVYRDPVDLVSSYHAFLLNEGWEDEPDFLKAWELQVERRRGNCVPKGARRPSSLIYGDVARLGEQIAYAKSKFGDRLKIFEFSDLTKDTDQVSWTIQDWLGLQYEELGLLPHTNPARAPRNKLINVLLKSPPAPLRTTRDVLKRIFGISSLGLVRRLSALNEKVINRQLSDRTRADLQSYFNDDVILLEQTTRRDLRAAWGWE